MEMIGSREYQEKSNQSWYEFIDELTLRVRNDEYRSLFSSFFNRKIDCSELEPRRINKMNDKNTKKIIEMILSMLQRSNAATIQCFSIAKKAQSSSIMTYKIGIVHLFFGHTNSYH